VLAFVVTIGFEAVYSAAHGVFFEPTNISALALTGAGYFVGMVCGILRIRVQRNERELKAIVADRTHELSEANARLEEMSLTDPLTGLRNRRFLAQHLEPDVAITLRRYEDWLADRSGSEAPHEADLLFFLIDLDHFKAINDRLGHQAGDQVLVAMRERLLAVFRESDFVVRWGGEEFLAVARASRREEAGEIAERIREAIAGRPFVLDGGENVCTSGSIGFAPFPFVPSAPRTVTWTQVVSLADQALYMAKSGGRNTWFGLFATSRTGSELLVERLAISGGDALRDGELEVMSPTAEQVARCR
jgi:diguanylate cyclase (GGDEF)-like protein